MAEVIKMPSLGETSSEGRIVRWLVHEGDAVELGQPLFTVETDKAELDVESVAEGVLLRVLVPEGEVVESGTPVAYVGEQGEDGQAR
jgi:pyruvate dehydrogenase E2 component (dihydrolipoamide acetyltransferase)